MDSKIGVAKLISSTSPNGIGQVGRDYHLEVDGVIVPGVISKTINLDCNERATLTVVMKLPEVIYQDKGE